MKKKLSHIALIAMVLTVVVLLSTLTVAATAAILYGDVNADGKINNQDLGLLQRYLAGWDVVLGPTDANGNAATTTTTVTKPLSPVGEYDWEYNNIPNGHLFKLTFFDQPTEGGYVGQWNWRGWMSLNHPDLPEGFKPSEHDEVVYINGVGYLMNAGNGGAFKIVEHGDTVIITTDFSEIILLERTDETSMTVISSDVFSVPVGAVFTAK